MQSNLEQTKLTKNGGFSFLMMIAVYFTLTLIGQSLLQNLSVKGGLLYYAISGCFSSISILAVILYICSKNKQNPIKVANYKPVNPVYFLYAIVLSIGMFFGCGFVNEAFSKVLQSWGLNAGGVNITINTATEFFVYTVVLAILPAIFEEAFFRGIMLNGLQGKAFNVSLTVGICFAVYHGNFSQFAYQLVYGISLCFLAIKAKSAFPSVLAHFINNFVVILFTYLKIQIDLTNVMVIVMGISLLAIYWISLSCYKSKKRTFEHAPHEESISLKQFWFPFGLCAVIVCVMLMVLTLFA